MDQTAKIAVLGAVGIVTVAAVMVVFSSRRSASGDQSQTASGARAPPTSSVSLPPSNKTTDITTTTNPDIKGANADTHDAAGGPLMDCKDVAESPKPLAPISSSSAVVSRDAPTETAAPAVAAAANGGGAVEKPETAEEEEQTREQELFALRTRFNSANSMARKFFKAQRYESAAEHYGIALALCDSLPNHEEKRTALHNNRGAAFEKCGKYALSLSECTMCLAREPDHLLARLRKSRVLEALGKPLDALNEVCAHLLLERDRVQAKALLDPTQPITPPPPPANLEGLLQKIATARAEAILAERAVKEKEAEECSEAGNADKRPLKPLPKQAVRFLLKSFGSFADMERQYAGMEESELTKQLEPNEDGEEASPSSRVSTLLERCRLRLVTSHYERARKDAFEAAELLSKLELEEDSKEESGETVVSGGIPPKVQAGVWEWQGTFLQLGAQLDAAKSAYERCQAMLEKDDKKGLTDVLIKLAWVHMDWEDMKTAEVFFTRAMENDPDYSSSYAHAARLHADSPEGPEMAKDYLLKALDRNKKDVFAWEQLAKLHLGAGNVQEVLDTVDEALKHAPKTEPLLSLKAELSFNIAMRMANQPYDQFHVPALRGMFDEAIAADPLSSSAYANKALFLFQMCQDVEQATQMLKEAAKLDPTSLTNLVQLANFKIMAAKSLEDGRSAAALLEKAVDLCSDREELIETLSVLVATEGRMNGALLLGRTSLG